MPDPRQPRWSDQYFQPDSDATRVLPTVAEQRAHRRQFAPRRVNRLRDALIVWILADIAVIGMLVVIIMLTRM